MAKPKSAKKPQHDDLARIYGAEGPSMKLGLVSFRFRAWTGQKKAVWIDPMITGATWSDAGGTMKPLTGELTLTLPRGADLPKTWKIQQGNRIDCYAKWGSGAWSKRPGYGRRERMVWTMRVYDERVTVGDGTQTLGLRDDMTLINRSKDDWDFRRKITRKGKKKSIGYRTDEVIRAVARRYHIPLGPIVKGRYRLKKRAWKDASPYEVIKEVVESEERETGVAYVGRWEPIPTRKTVRRGRRRVKVVTGVRMALVVRPVRRNRVVWQLGPHILTAEVGRLRRKGLATSVAVHSSVKVGRNRKGKKAKRRKVVTKPSVRSARGLKEFGLIHKEVTHAGLETEAEARGWGKRYLAEHLRQAYTLELTHPGIPTMRAGDLIEVSIPTEGIAGLPTFMRRGKKKKRVWVDREGAWVVTEIAHQVTAGDYQMTLTLSRKNANVARIKSAKKDYADLLKARRKRKGKKGKKGGKK